MIENKELIAFCGLYCGDCFNYKGEIADLARDLRKKLREARFDRASQGLSKFFKEFENYEQCYEVLGSMIKLRCRRACRGGGGHPSCRIRNCCQNKNLQGCWDCEEFGTCEKLGFLRPIHRDANLKNLGRIKREGVDGFLNGTRHW